MFLISTTGRLVTCFAKETFLWISVLPVRDPEEQQCLMVTVKNLDPVARCRSCIRLEIFAKTGK